MLTPVLPSFCISTYTRYAFCPSGSPSSPGRRSAPPPLARPDLRHSPPSPRAACRGFAAGPGCPPAPPGPPARRRQPEQRQASWPRLEAHELALYKLSITRTISLKININRPYEHFHIVSITTSNDLAAPERNGHLSWFLLAAEALHPSSCAAHILP